MVPPVARVQPVVLASVNLAIVTPVPVPFTSRGAPGAVVPIPTRPLLRTVKMFVVVAMVRSAFEAEVLVPILRAVVKLEVAVAMKVPLTWRVDEGVEIGRAHV